MVNIATRKATLFVLIQGLVFCQNLLAQKQVDRRSLYWIRYYNTVNFNARWNWQTELDTRHFFVNQRQQQFITHTRVAYKPNTRWSFSLGLTGSWLRPQSPYTTPRPTTPELRMVQEASINQPFSPALSLNYRIRTEERFISNHTGAFDQDNHFSFRHRYRVQLTYVLKKTGLTFRGSDEVFVNGSSEDLFDRMDQNRVYLSLEKRFSPVLAFEVGYMNINQPIKGKSLIVKRDNLRLTLYHTLSLHSEVR